MLIEAAVKAGAVFTPRDFTAPAKALGYVLILRPYRKEVMSYARYRERVRGMTIDDFSKTR